MRHRVCGGESGAVVMTLRGVAIPFVSPRVLLRMKQTYRSKDELDRAFLVALLHEKEE